MSHTYRWNIIITTFATRQSKLYQDQVRNDSAGLEVPPYVTAGSSEEWDTIRSHLPPLGRPLSLNRALSPNTNNHTPSCMPGVKIWLLANPSQPSLTFVKESRSSLRGKMIAVRWSRDKRSDIFKGAGLSASLSTKQDLIYQEINSTNALEKPSLRWWHSGHRGYHAPQMGGSQALILYTGGAVSRICVLFYIRVWQNAKSIMFFPPFPLWCNFKKASGRLSEECSRKRGGAQLLRKNTERAQNYRILRRGGLSITAAVCHDQPVWMRGKGKVVSHCNLEVSMYVLHVSAANKAVEVQSGFTQLQHKKEKHACLRETLELRN